MTGLKTGHYVLLTSRSVFSGHWPFAAQDEQECLCYSGAYEMD
jgi:hypothetical protein